MNIQLYKEKINSINNKAVNLLMSSVNEETGEIDSEKLQEIESLELKKEEAITVLGLFHHELNAMSQSIENDPMVIEAKRKLELSKQYKSNAESIKNFLSKFIPEGEKIQNENIKISWRSSESLETDYDFDIEEVEIIKPEFVKVEKTLRKKELKDFYKTTDLRFKGTKIIKKQNIQIK